jgi:hypothetical protein
MQSTKPEEWIHFPYEILFSDKTLLPNWICSLAQIANDLGITNMVLEEKMGDDPNNESPEVSYYFALACSHLREATKYLFDTLELPEVKDFVAELDTPAQDNLVAIKSTYEPWENSFIQTVAMPIRNSVFHYPKPDEKEWSDLRIALKDAFGEFRVRGTDITSARFVFADDIRLNYYQLLLKQNNKDLESNISTLAKVGAEIFVFAQIAVIHFMDKMPSENIYKGRR